MTLFTVWILPSLMTSTYRTRDQNDVRPGLSSKWQVFKMIVGEYTGFWRGFNGCDYERLRQTVFRLYRFGSFRVISILSTCWDRSSRPTRKVTRHCICHINDRGLVTDSHLDLLQDKRWLEDIIVEGKRRNFKSIK